MPVTSALLSAGVLSAMVAVSLMGCSSEPTIESTGAPTSATRSRYPEPIDLANARASCLESKGWSVAVSDDAEISASLNNGTEADYRHDDSACLKHLGIDPDAPPTEAQYRQAFEESKHGAVCLRRAGWQISEAPTFTTFKDTYDTDAWYPWAQVPDADLNEAIEACPAPEPTY